MNKIQKAVIYARSIWYVRKFKNNPQKTIDDTLKNASKCVRISKGEWGYTVFNCSYMSNMANLALMCLSQGKIPVMDFHAKTEYPSNDWECFFEQPFFKGDTEDVAEVLDMKNGLYRDTRSSIYREDEVKLWGALYNVLFKLNPCTRLYVDQEIKECIGEKRVLGVLVRGTDYTDTKPKGHPIQPEIEDVFVAIKEEMNRTQYDGIYLATEEERVVEVFKQKFPGIIITNKRSYYDKIYYENKYKLIGSVHFERENDDYYKGLEYLSSVWILSNCKSLIAGHCGGSRTAVFLNNGKYDYVKVFDLGLY